MIPILFQNAMSCLIKFPTNISTNGRENTEKATVTAIIKHYPTKKNFKHCWTKERPRENGMEEADDHFLQLYSMYTEAKRIN